LKDLPGSKTLLVALAWGVVTSLLPPLAQEGRFLPATLVAFLYTSILVFVRSTLYDFKDIQGDLMVGKETIPIVLGTGKTETLVVLLLIFLGAALTAAATLKWTTSLASVLLISLCYVVSYYYLYRQKITAWGFLFEWAVDGSFIFRRPFGLPLGDGLKAERKSAPPRGGSKIGRSAPLRSIPPAAGFEERPPPVASRQIQNAAVRFFFASRPSGRSSSEAEGGTLLESNRRFDAPQAKPPGLRSIPPAVD